MKTMQGRGKRMSEGSHPKSKIGKISREEDQHEGNPPSGKEKEKTKVPDGEMKMKTKTELGKRKKARRRKRKSKVAKNQ